MSTPAKMARAEGWRAGVSVPESTAAHAFGRAKHMKPELAEHLRRERLAEGISQEDMPIRQQTVSEWENESQEDRAPNLLHILAMGRCKGSRPYAISALRWIAAKLGFELTPHIAIVHSSEAVRVVAVTTEITDVLRVNAMTAADGRLCEDDLEQRVGEARQAIAALQEQLASDLAQLEALRSEA